MYPTRAWIVPPAYSSNSGCELSGTTSSGCTGLSSGLVVLSACTWLSSGLIVLSVIADLPVIEPCCRLVGAAQRAGKHTPDEDAERTEAHQHCGRVGSCDLEAGHALLPH